jgi:hypothetical protein
MVSVTPSLSPETGFSDYFGYFADYGSGGTAQVDIQIRLEHAAERRSQCIADLGCDLANLGI